MIKENKFSKYFLYAIGEIVLVVVGILIALSINNWNEYKKDRIKEKLILNGLAKSLKNNNSLLQQSIQSLEQYNISSDLILKVLEAKSEYSDTLDIHFSQAVHRGSLLSFITYEGFKTYENEGFNIVKNESLKNSIIHLYTVKFQELSVGRDMFNSFFPEDYNLWFKHFYEVEQPRSLKPFDFLDLQRDKEIYARLKHIKLSRMRYINDLKESLEGSQDLLQLIKDELSKSD